MVRLKYIAFCMVLFVSWRSAETQLLYDTQRVEDEHINYARQGYRPYPPGVFGRTTKNVYDELGNFVMEGIEVFHLDESRTNAPLPGSFIDKGRFYGAYLNRLVVAQDNYRNWDSRLIIGDRIRTKFTSLTLDMVALNGVRWDLNVDESLFTFVMSRQDWPIYNDADNAQHNARDWATYLLGGHAKRRFGVMDLSLSYVNQHRTNSLVAWEDNSLKGVLPNANTPPAYVVVKIGDDSEDDRSGPRVGPRVYDVWIDELIVDMGSQRLRFGQTGDEAAIWGDLRHPKVTRHDRRTVDPADPNRDQFFPDNRAIPSYIQFLKGHLPLEEKENRRFFDLREGEYLLYWFRIPQELRGQIVALKFKAELSNDYRIELSEVYLPGGVASSSNPDVTGERATFFYTAAAAPGNVQDHSNRSVVSFEYGRQTGRTNVSMRMEIERKGFFLRSEYAHTLNFLQYPSGAGGNRWRRENGGAFFVNLKKTQGPVIFGGEYFHLSPRYSTILSVEDPQFRSYTDFLESPFSVFPNFPRRYNNTIEFSSVDDNDDRDRFPDFHFLSEFSDDSVFPGLDQNQDGRLDFDRNANLIPDYLEPFLLYDTDPPEYDYGDDLNNNNVIDHREDDLKPDYPYDTDRKGHHVFVTLLPQPALDVTLGYYDTKQLWRSGRNRVAYAKLDYQRSLYPFGRIQLANTFKRVEDDIPDDTPQFAPMVSNALPLQVRGSTGGAPIRVLVEDRLEMRNSLVNVAYVEGTLFRIDNLTIDGRCKYTHNLQRRTPLQPNNAIRELAWVLRSDYGWKFGRLSLSPRVKVMGFKRNDAKGLQHRISEGFFFPMIMLDYEFTPMTRFSAGAQGLPFFQSRYRDFENPAVDFSSQDYLATLTNMTTYNGYHLSLNMGYHLKLLHFDDRSRRTEDIDRSLFFIRLVMGLEPFRG